MSTLRSFNCPSQRTSRVEGARTIAYRTKRSSEIIFDGESNFKYVLALGGFLLRVFALLNFISRYYWEIKIWV